MEHHKVEEALQDKDADGRESKAASDVAKDVQNPAANTPASYGPPLDVTDPKAQENAEHGEVVGGEGSLGEVNMEATISADDVIRAGGFGARDDISSLLPVASDSTDFEAAIRDARDYEEPQGETCRPGLGWSKPR